MRTLFTATEEEKKRLRDLARLQPVPTGGLIATGGQIYANASGIVLVAITEKVPKSGSGKGKLAYWDGNSMVAGDGEEIDVRDVTVPGMGPAQVNEIWKCNFGDSGAAELISCGCP